MFIGDDSDDLIYDPTQAPILHQAFPSVRPPTLARRTKFLEEHEGFRIKEGKFKRYEDAEIVQNYENFLEFYKIHDSTATRCALFGFMLEDPESAEIVDLVKQLVQPCGFYYRMATNLPNRLISSVFGRARKLFNPFRAQKEIDKETQRDIIQYCISQGKSKKMYAHIANQFNVDPIAARRIVVKTIDLDDEIEYRKGVWSRTENIRLLDAICNNLNIDPENITRQMIMDGKISWVQVSKDVRTRHSVQCQNHTKDSLINNLEPLKMAVIKRRMKREQS